MARDKTRATMHSVKVNFGLARSSWRSRSACSSASRTSSKRECWERALYHMKLQMLDNVGKEEEGVLHAERDDEEDGCDLTDSEDVVLEYLFGEFVVFAGFFDSTAL
jgi:hypothetical protein